MVLPRDARQKGGTIQIGVAMITLLILCCTLTLLLSRPTHALSLLPSVNLVVPTGELLTPATGTINKITGDLRLPVTIGSTSSSLGVSISAPQLSRQPSSSPLQASVAIPVPSVIPSVLNTVNDAVSPVTETVSMVANSPSLPLPSTPIALNPSTAQPANSNEPGSLASQNSNKGDTSPVLSGDNEKSVAVASAEPFLAETATFIGSTIPSTINNLISGIANPNINTLPILISIGMFILMLALITGIVYILNHNKSFASGDGRFAQLAQRYDLTQLFVLSVVVIGTSLIVLYLVLSRATG